MPEPNDHTIQLFNRYVAGTATIEEQEEFFTNLQRMEDAGALKESIVTLFREAKEEMAAEEVNWEAMFLRVIKPAAKLKSLHWFRYAAAIIVMLGIGMYMWFTNANKDIQPVKQQADLTPGVNKATLTLADGSIILLDSAANGNLAQQGNTKVIKLNNRQLAYSSHGINSDNITTSYNTITTPRGSQYQIVLPDGTNVWLNAASSLKFPTVFTGNQRKVELTGEAYFEVYPAKRSALIKGKKHQTVPAPFIVKAAGTEVLVLATAFNINAYQDEPTQRTTLLEGSIRVTKDNNSVLVKPGQQAVANKDSVHLQSTIGDPTAWKIGYFSFTGKDIQTILRQLARWYDVEIINEATNAPTTQLVGEVPNSMSLVKVIKALELSGINLKLEDKKLIITN